MSKQTIIWQICDGKPGHDNQGKGLINALNSLIECRVFVIRASGPIQNLFNFLLKKFPAGSDLPAPDYIIGAGHNTHLTMLNAQRVYGGKTIVLMKPSLPYTIFDYCIIPAHDNPPEKKNIIVSRGAINMLSPAVSASDKTGLILLGGPSKHFNWDTQHIINQLNGVITGTPGINWCITNSRRTPESTMYSIENQQWNNAIIFDHRVNNEINLPELFSRSGTVWVTEDSVSMIYEALTCCNQVGLLTHRSNKTNKIRRSIRDLSQQGLITFFDDWIPGQRLKIKTGKFNEAQRCAKLILKMDES